MLGAPKTTFRLGDLLGGLADLSTWLYSQLRLTTMEGAHGSREGSWDKVQGYQTQASQGLLQDVLNSSSNES